MVQKEFVGLVQIFVKAEISQQETIQQTLKDLIFFGDHNCN